MAKKLNVIRLKGLHISTHFKVWEPKFIKVSDIDEFEFRVKIQRQTFKKL